MRKHFQTGYFFTEEERPDDEGHETTIRRSATHEGPKVSDFTSSSKTGPLSPLITIFIYEDSSDSVFIGSCLFIYNDSFLYAYSGLGSETSYSS